MVLQLICHAANEFSAVEVTAVLAIVQHKAHEATAAPTLLDRVRMLLKVRDQRVGDKPTFFNRNEQLNFSCFFSLSCAI